MKSGVRERKKKNEKAKDNSAENGEVHNLCTSIKDSIVCKKKKKKKSFFLSFHFLITSFYNRIMQ